MPALYGRRWYATATTLSTGNVLISAGREFDCNDTLVDEDYPLLFDPDPFATQQWTVLNQAASQRVLHWYPFMFVMKSGHVFMAGGANFKINSTASIHRDTYKFDLADIDMDGTHNEWDFVDQPDLPEMPGGSALMYRPNKVMKAGGGEHQCPTGGSDLTPGSTDVRVIDLDAGTPNWTSGSPMIKARRDFYLIALPDGRVFATGGRMPVPYVYYLQPEWFDPDGTAGWELLAPMTQRREYHSSAVLLPDGRIMVGGGQFAATQAQCDAYTGTACAACAGENVGTCFQRTIEIFSPPYLFDSNNNPAPRPTITSAPAEVTYNSWFNIHTPQASTVTSACLIRLGAATHSFDQDQRSYAFDEIVVPLGGGKIRVQAPPNGNHAPPGYYMLFITTNGDRGGIFYPSVARIIKLKA